MKNQKSEPEKQLVIMDSEIPLESNLGLLAYGDIAFTAWRKLKKESKKNSQHETE